MVRKGQRLHPRRSYGCGVGIEDAANDLAAGEHIEIVLIPVAGSAACRGSFENKQLAAGFYHCHRFALQSSSASRFTAGAAGFLLLIQCRERPET